MKYLFVFNFVNILKSIYQDSAVLEFQNVGNIMMFLRRPVRTGSEFIVHATEKVRRNGTKFVNSKVVYFTTLPVTAEAKICSCAFKEMSVFFK